MSLRWWGGGIPRPMFAAWGNEDDGTHYRNGTEKHHDGLRFQLGKSILKEKEQIEGVQIAQRHIPLANGLTYNRSRL